ncbi:MAG: protein O-mannosyl-transferase family [Sediminibacterium sp.]
MISFQRANIILGWFMFMAATAVYMMTLEPTMPFWDCGEFIASAYKLEVGHPPGAPLFMLIARLFSAFVGVENVPFAINSLSAVSSGATIMFLFWTITHLAKKMVDKDGDQSDNKNLIIFAAGLIGAFAYTFSDTFWFSAVEGEVYAMSSLFTAVVFWAILKWESEADEPSNLRWIILIAYLMGLSIGVHLLNLLAIPSICFVYYFKKNTFSWKGVAITSAVALGLLFLMQTVILIWSIQIAAWFERIFTNTLGMPFNTGVLFYALILIGGLVLLIISSKKRGWVVLNTLTWSIAVALIGYTTFATIVIRSQADTPMNENKPNNFFALVSYMNREQYGDRPLLRGQYFNTPQARTKPYLDGNEVYVKSYSVREDSNKNKLVVSFKNRFEAEQYISNHTDQKLMLKEEYLETGEKKATEPNYTQTHVFPRMYSSQGSHIQQYKIWADLKDLKRTPTFSENMGYFFSYQVNWMYWRYFMWNFAGRQNDTQGHGDFVDGNWKTGIGFYDEARLGNQEFVPEISKNSKANNSYYMIPLLIGLLGLVYQLLRHRNDFIVVGLLFVLTGFAIVVYLNQTPLQPRERDYAYAGSFYAFAIWIGLGVTAIYFWLKLMLKNIPSAALAGIAFALSLVAPVLMAAQGWDDHDRSDRRTGIDMAKNYLNSLQPNAIIFTNGDNDTFPLWYAQEVEGVRTDVRVVNLSLLNTDWYIDQMKRRQYESAPVPFSIPEFKYRQGTRDLIVLNSEETVTPLEVALSYCLDDSKIQDFGYKKFSVMPNYQFSYAVSKENQAKFSQYVGANDSLVNTMSFALMDDDGENPRQFITKAQLMVMDLIVHNNWERPIYFAVTTGSEAYMGLEPYFQLEGLAYRLTPIYHTDFDRDNMSGGVASELMYENVMNKFLWGNIDTKDIYLDENNRRMVTNLRMQMNNLAEQFIIEKKMDKAAAVLNKSINSLPEKNAPYDQPQIMWQTAELLFKAGDLQTATKLAERVFALNNQMLDYYQSLTKPEKKTIERKMQMSAFVNEELVKDLEAYAPGSEAAKNMRAAHEAALKNVGLLELMKEERGKKEAFEAQMKVRDSLIKVLGQEKFDSLSNVKKVKGKF